MAFTINFLLFSETGKKSLALQAIPTQNLQKKSHEGSKRPERRQIVKEILVSKEINKTVYKSLEDLWNKISKLKLSYWIKEYETNKVTLKTLMRTFSVYSFVSNKMGILVLFFEVFKVNIFQSISGT